MRNSKPQTPNSNKPSTRNLQPRGASRYLPRPGANGKDNGAWVLRDESPKASAPHPFDFEERTARFGEAIVRFSKKIPLGPTNNRLIDQLVGAGTSVGANFCEASDCVSKKDFRYTVKRCIKEAKETRFFLRMVVASERSLREAARPLYREATELVRILATMHGK
jgi:four helix bundle protein